MPVVTPSVRAALREVLTVVTTFVLLGLVAGVVWRLLAHPPYFVRTAQGAVMDQAELAKRIQADGVFMVIGLVAGLLSGLVLTWRCRRVPLLTLLVGGVAAAGAGFLALALGRTLGHVDVSAAVSLLWGSNPADDADDPAHELPESDIAAPQPH